MPVQRDKVHLLIPEKQQGWFRAVEKRVADSWKRQAVWKLALATLARRKGIPPSQPSKDRELLEAGLRESGVLGHSL